MKTHNQSKQDLTKFMVRTGVLSAVSLFAANLTACGNNYMARKSLNPAQNAAARPGSPVINSFSYQLPASSTTGLTMQWRTPINQEAEYEIRVCLPSASASPSPSASANPSPSPNVATSPNPATSPASGTAPIVIANNSDEVSPDPSATATTAPTPAAGASGVPSPGPSSAPSALPSNLSVDPTKCPEFAMVDCTKNPGSCNVVIDSKSEDNEANLKLTQFSASPSEYYNLSNAGVEAYLANVANPSAIHLYIRANVNGQAGAFVTGTPAAASN